MKQCSKCFEQKQDTDFYKGRICKVCTIKRNTVYALSHPKKKEWAHKSKLKTRYNLTPDEYENLKQKSGLKCEICSKQNVELVIDHNHETLKVRGLLCRYCNLALGHFSDNIETLELAIKYLKENN